MRKKSILSVFLMILMLSSSLSSGNLINKKEPKNLESLEFSYSSDEIFLKKAKWTVMYYMCGDSSLEIYISPLLENLSKIASSKDLKIVVLKDTKEKDDSRLYYINESGIKIELNTLLGWPEEVDMSNKNTFELFCSQVMEAFPASHYAFVTYANGATGWQTYPLDDRDGRGFLTIPELAESLKKITKNGTRKFDILQTSCCMSNIELSYEIAPYVDYLVTTQEHIAHKDVVPRCYRAVWDLKNNTDMNPEEFASRYATRHKPHSFQYFVSYGERLCFLTKILNKLPYTKLHTVMMHSSVAIINLSKIDGVVESLQNLSSYLLLYIDDKNIVDTLKYSRDNVRAFGKAFPKYWVFSIFYNKLPLEMFSYNCRIDLFNLVDLLSENVEYITIKNLCFSLMEKINYSIVELNKLPDDQAHGFNIYFPTNFRMYNKNLFVGKLPCPYEKLRLSEDIYWDDFLRKYLNV